MQNIVLVQSLRTYSHVVYCSGIDQKHKIFSFFIYSSGAYLNACVQTLTSLSILERTAVVQRLSSCIHALIRSNRAV